MHLTKSNLLIAGVASKDKEDGPLRALRMEDDGTTVAACSTMLLAMEPSPANQGKREEGARVNLRPEHVDAVLKAGGRSEGARVVPALKEGEVALETSKGVLGDRPLGAVYPDWRSMIGAVKGSEEVRLCVNRKELIALLQAVERACPDRSGLAPLFLEVGSKGIVVRAESHETGQRALGVVKGYDTKGHWLEKNRWEKRVMRKKLGSS